MHSSLALKLAYEARPCTRSMPVDDPLTLFPVVKGFLKAPNLVVLRSLPCLPLRVVVGYTAALAQVVHCSVRIFKLSEMPARTQDETVTRSGLFVVYK